MEELRQQISSRKHERRVVFVEGSEEEEGVKVDEGPVAVEDEDQEEHPGDNIVPKESESAALSPLKRTKYRSQGLTLARTPRSTSLMTASGSPVQIRGPAGLKLGPKRLSTTELQQIQQHLQQRNTNLDADNDADVQISTPAEWLDVLPLEAFPNDNAFASQATFRIEQFGDDSAEEDKAPPDNMVSTEATPNDLQPPNLAEQARAINSLLEEYVALGGETTDFDERLGEFFNSVLESIELALRYKEGGTAPHKDLVVDEEDAALETLADAIVAQEESVVVEPLGATTAGYDHQWPADDDGIRDLLTGTSLEKTKEETDVATLIYRAWFGNQLNRK